MLANRVAPPDIILKEVMERSGDKPFDNIDDIILRAELAAMLQRYRQVAGYDLARLKAMAGEG